MWTLFLESQHRSCTFLLPGVKFLTNPGYSDFARKSWIWEPVLSVDKLGCLVSDLEHIQEEETLSFMYSRFHSHIMNSQQKLKFELSLSLEATLGCAVLSDRCVLLTHPAHDLNNADMIISRWSQICTLLPSTNLKDSGNLIVSSTYIMWYVGFSVINPWGVCFSPPRPPLLAAEGCTGFSAVPKG